MSKKTIAEIIEEVEQSPKKFGDYRESLYVSQKQGTFGPAMTKTKESSRSVAWGKEPRRKNHDKNKQSVHSKVDR